MSRPLNSLLPKFCANEQKARIIERNEGAVSGPQ